MCGRYALRNQELQREFVKYDWTAAGAGKARYNVAPTQRVLAVTNDPTHSRPRAEWMRWGLVPSWAKDPKAGAPMINARSEGIEGKPMFRAAWKVRRCAVFADGFVEWRKEGDGKIPMLFELNNGKPFAFAGLWETWTPKDGSGEPLRSCTVITCTPNDLVARVHDRMPVILHTPEAVEAWLGSASDLALSARMLAPLPAELMRVTEVNPLVNNARNDSPDCLAPAKAG